MSTPIFQRQPIQTLCGNYYYFSIMRLYAYRISQYTMVWTNIFGSYVMCKLNVWQQINAIRYSYWIKHITSPLLEKCLVSPHTILHRINIAHMIFIFYFLCLCCFQHHYRALLTDLPSRAIILICIKNCTVCFSLSVPFSSGYFVA